jgi:cell division protein FtsL
MTGIEKLLLIEFVVLSGFFFFSFFLTSKKNSLWNEVHNGNKENIKQTILMHHDCMNLSEKVDKIIIAMIVIVLITILFFISHVFE